MNREATRAVALAPPAVLQVVRLEAPGAPDLRTPLLLVPAFTILRTALPIARFASGRAIGTMTPPSSSGLLPGRRARTAPERGTLHLHSNHEQLLRRQRASLALRWPLRNQASNICRLIPVAGTVFSHRNGFGGWTNNGTGNFRPLTKCARGCERGQNTPSCTWHSEREAIKNNVKYNRLA